MADPAYLVDQLEALMASGRSALVRRALGVQSFGINAWRGAEAGADLVSDHDELASGQEELYLVIDGDATFTVDGREIDAPTGTILFVSDPAARRSAVANRAGTTVLVAGARPGYPFTVGGWEAGLEVIPLFGEGRYEEAKEMLHRLIESGETSPITVYNLACAESRLGEVDAALEHLASAIAGRPDLRKLALSDSDLDSIRDDPRFSGIVENGSADSESSASASAETEKGGSVTHSLHRLVDIVREDGWAPIRRVLGVRAFGINAWSGAKAGDELVPEHEERETGHEELYLVISGRATFTVDGDEIDAPTGTIVFVREPPTIRKATASTAETVVLAIGGEPGKAFEPCSWELNRDTLALFDAGQYEDAQRLLMDALDEYQDQSFLLYNLACAEARLGRSDQAFEHLGQALAARPELIEAAGEDEDLAPLRDDPRFNSLTAR